MSSMAQSLAQFGKVVFVTDYGTVEVSERTIAAMDAQFPGWRGECQLQKGRSRKARWARNRAARGEELLDAAVTAIARLAFNAGQDLVEV